jgi:NADPH2:quinone reductase
MKAVLVTRPGGPEALELRDVEEPAPGNGEVLVEVAAAGVNFIDVYFRTGAYPRPTPFVVGSEGAGRVLAAGAGVSGLTPGDPVTWAMVPGAGYAERVAVPADRLVPVPGGVELETAAAVMLQGMTAHYLVTSTFPLAEGSVALVHAAAGGVGLLLTQAAVARGARVLATTSTEEKAQLARGAGASEVIRYDTADVAAEVRRLTDGRGVDVVYDGVGRATWEASLDSLRPRGLMCLYGASSGAPDPVDPQVLNAKGSLFLTRPSLAHHVADRDELLWRAGEVLDWVCTGALHVRVGQRYPLGEAARAHADLEGRRTTGKSLVVPSL